MHTTNWLVIPQVVAHRLRSGGATWTYGRVMDPLLDSGHCSLSSPPKKTHDFKALCTLLAVESLTAADQPRTRTCSPKIPINAVHEGPS